MTHLKVALGAILLTLCFSSHAALVTYILGDHENALLYKAPATSGDDGPYGLRVDAIDPPNGTGPTFSVGDNLGGFGGQVLLSWNDDFTGNAVISGTLYRNDDGTLWDVVYTMTGLAAAGSALATTVKAPDRRRRIMRFGQVIVAPTHWP